MCLFVSKKKNKLSEFVRTHQTPRFGFSWSIKKKFNMCNYKHNRPTTYFRDMVLQWPIGSHELPIVACSKYWLNSSAIYTALRVRFGRARACSEKLYSALRCTSDTDHRGPDDKFLGQEVGCINQELVTRSPDLGWLPPKPLQKISFETMTGVVTRGVNILQQF